MSKPIMLSENSRKSATKLLLVNWSRFSNVSIALEGSTLFTGVNGSGKSTILDAMTYMLTGNTQFNKAALDRDRNVVSYVRGDTKSEGKNRFIREGEVTSYIAMEFWANLEHKLRYKKSIPEDTVLITSAELSQCAEMSALLDRKMQNIRDLIENS